MASPVILRVCEPCHDTGEATGGLRDMRGSLFCARCTVVCEIVASLTHAAFECDEDGARDFGAFCAAASRRYIERSVLDFVPQTPVAIVFADN